MSVIVNGKEYYGIIYKITNTINNKVYIGQTANKRGFNGRYDYRGVGIERVYQYSLKKSQGNHMNYNLHLLRAIEKYGFDAFTVDEVFDVANTKEELNAKERYYIAQFDSYANGYNRSLGGESTKGAAQPRGKDAFRSVPVCQISIDGELIKVWDSMADAAASLNMSKSHIGCVCRHHRKLAGGFVWVYSKDYNPNINYKVRPHKKDAGKGTKPVYLLSDDNKIIQEFYCVNYAAECLGISNGEVSLICNHKIKEAPLNLIFKSEYDEYIEEQRLNMEGSVA